MASRRQPGLLTALIGTTGARLKRPFAGKAAGQGRKGGRGVRRRSNAWHANTVRAGPVRGRGRALEPIRGLRAEAQVPLNPADDTGGTARRGAAGQIRPSRGLLFESDSLKPPAASNSSVTGARNSQDDPLDARQVAWNDLMHSAHSPATASCMSSGTGTSRQAPLFSSGRSVLIRIHLLCRHSRLTSTTSDRLATVAASRRERL